MKDNTIKKRSLAQYYTSVSLGEVLISMLPISGNIYAFLDLCAGTGSLLASAEKASSRSKIYGIDLDKNNVDYLKANHPSYTIFSGDSLRSDNLAELLKICSSFDFVIGNPPFKSIPFDKEICNDLESPFLVNADKKIRAEVCFLAKGISLLKRNGYLAYILPDGILTNFNFKALREYLAFNFEIKEIREIPEGEFIGTEAKTHILVLKNSRPKCNHRILLSSLENNLTKWISNNDFIKRADYSFHDIPVPISFLRLNEYDVLLLRGNSESKIKNNKSYLHTTSFKKNYNEFYGSDSNLSCISNGQKFAVQGDILIPRVGSRCLGKVGYIVSGEFFVSDCIIIIRVNEVENRNRILSNLRSDFGIRWIKTVARGVGAKHITLTDIKNFPVI
ncbi:hypothetical protein NB703_004292 [Pantoea ananatis]|uniref:DNA methylase adenine-specific domain-containing protein n=1 Tax=Pantoea ananas TaxID=553 RepID=A0AAJ1FT74_PANAN|nr:N-6 DNA methylase [Pantoea ananatis]MCW0346199.1 hypothetical protein [Pantoea ananatis]